MAKVICIRCRETILNHQDCPTCGTPDYLSDPDNKVSDAAVGILVDNLILKCNKEREFKLQDIKSLKPKWHHKLTSWMERNL